MKNSVFGFRCLLCWFLISLCVVVFSRFDRPPDIMGDGVEYLLMTQAVVGRGAVSLEESDVKGFLAEPGNSKIANAKQLIYSGIVSNSPPFYKAKSGKVYSYHFWLASVFFSPFVLLARSVGLADTSGFLLANLSLVCLVIFCFFRFCRFGCVSAIFGSVLYLSVGAVYYIRWPHPEIFSASLLCLALLLFRRGNRKVSALLMAVAGQQNPPILLLIFFVFAADLSVVLRGEVRRFFSFAFSWSAVAALASLSSIFYFIEFGSFNLISSKGFSDLSLVSIHRLASIYFDPNIGIFWVVPFALFASLLLPFLSRGAGAKGGGAWVGVFLFMSLVCALPSLSTTNWNSGAAIVSRYGFWSSVPLIFVFMEVFGDGVATGVRALMLLTAVGQGWLVFYNGGAFHRRGDQEFSGVAKFLLDKTPNLYLPVPQIFVERGQNYGGVASDRVYYWSQSGKVNKILFNKFQRKFSLDVCSSGSSRDYLTSVHEVESGWVYWSLREGCLVDVADGFHAVKTVPVARRGDVWGPSAAVFYDGWSKDEVTNRWSLGGRSVLKFKTTPGVRSVAISGFVFGSQRVSVLLNGRLYYSGDAPENGVFIFDLTSVLPGEECELVFYWPDARKWDDSDARELAFSVKEISFN